LISLRKTVSELEQLEDFKRTALECYALSLAAVKDHAIEVDAAQLAGHRSRLQTLRDQVKPDTAAEQLREVQSSFNTELHEYSEKAAQHIQRLRNDVRAASEAVEVFTGSFAASATDLDVEVKRELQRLDKAARLDDINAIRSAISIVSAGIASSFERMRSSNQLAIAQLKDEIRVLHREIEAARRPQTSSSASPKQQEVFGHIDNFLRQNMPFSLILIAVKNLRGLESCHPKAAIESALSSLHARFQGALPPGSRSGRWSEAQFVAILTVEPSAAMAMSRDLTKKLSGSYPAPNGLSKSVVLEATAGVIDWKTQGDPSSLHRRLEQLSDALAKA
jgi:GGDEF domain-containing protein